jgi:hypothetical protein
MQWSYSTDLVTLHLPSPTRVAAVAGPIARDLAATGDTTMSTRLQFRGACWLRRYNRYVFGHRTVCLRVAQIECAL